MKSHNQASLDASTVEDLHDMMSSYHYAGGVIQSIAYDLEKQMITREEAIRKALDVASVAKDIDTVHFPEYTKR